VTAAPRKRVTQARLRELAAEMDKLPPGSPWQGPKAQMPDVETSIQDLRAKVLDECREAVLFVRGQR
jgi:hypothetical protein